MFRFAPAFTPVFVYRKGPGDCCSDQCSCGCNNHGACPCTGKPAPKAQEPPKVVETAPFAGHVDSDGVLNYGIDRSKIPAADKPRYFFRGKETTREDVLKRLTEGSVFAGNDRLADDSTKARLTVIGSEAERKRVLGDLKTSAALAPYKDQVLVQAYAPDHWAVQCGFKREGKPTIYLETAAGNVLHRQDDYNDGAEGLATALAKALRKPDPNYDPTKDKDRRKPDLLPDLFSDLDTNLVGAGLVVGLAFLFLLFKK